MLALLPLLMLAAPGTAVRPAPGWPFPIPTSVSVKPGVTIRLDATGKGATAGPVPDGIFESYRWVAAKHADTPAFYYPLNYRQVAVKIPEKVSVDSVCISASGPTWDHHVTVKPFVVDGSTQKKIVITLPPGDWKLAVLAHKLAPLFVDNVHVSTADVSLTLPAVSQQAGGVDGVPIDPSSGRPPKTWQAYATRTGPSPQSKDTAGSKDISFFHDVPLAENGDRLDFESLPPGSWELRLESPGYTPARRTITPVVANEILHAGEIRFTKGGELDLVVTFPEEAPTGDVTMSIFRGSSRSALRAAPLQRERRRSDHEIRVHFADIEPGLVTIVVTQRESGLYATAETAIQPDQLATANISLSPIRISGTVWRGDVPLTDCSVKLMGQGSGALGQATTGSDATYALVVWTPGTYLLNTTPSNEHLPFAEILVVPDDAREVPHDIRLPAGRITGSVRDADNGKAIAKAEIDYEPTPPPPGSPPADMNYQMSAQSDAEGMFSLKNLRAEPLDITASADGYEQKAIKSITPTDDGVQLDILLRRSGGLKGTVVDSAGAPVSMAVVGLDDDGNGDFAQSAQTLSDGSFSFSSVSDGSHVLVAFSCSHAIAVTTTDVPAPDEGVTLVLPLALSGLQMHFSDETKRPVANRVITLSIGGIRLPGEYPYRFLRMCQQRGSSDADGNLSLAIAPFGQLQATSFPDGADLGSFLNDQQGLTWAIELRSGAAPP
jgi:hypothetical protein